MSTKIVSNLKFDSRRVPGSVVVTDTKNPSLYAFIAKIQGGPQRGKHQATCLGLDKSFPANPALYIALNALPCGPYPTVKQAVIDAIAASKATA